MKTVLFLLFFLSHLFACGQKMDVILGTVKDTADNNTLPGVTVILKFKDTQIITTTCENGKYTVMIPEDVDDFYLEFFFIGMKSKRIHVNRNKNIKPE
jgi:hypothetical protein